MTIAAALLALAAAGADAPAGMLLPGDPVDYAGLAFDPERWKERKKRDDLETSR